MRDPYQVLDVSADVDDAALRRRYLELVRRYPPERCPQQFAEVREAYEQLRDPARRLERELFKAGGCEILDDVIAGMRSKLQERRIATETLLSLAER
ncbi:MAG: J domain-containing protein [Planctomycetaceae bacterium]|nr:J domain-containing protein [Planctomycetaceae bacterium]